jgi:hypothetical protein
LHRGSTHHTHLTHRICRLLNPEKRPLPRSESRLYDRSLLRILCQCSPLFSLPFPRLTHRWMSSGSPSKTPLLNSSSWLLSMYLCCASVCLSTMKVTHTSHVFNSQSLQTGCSAKQLAAHSRKLVVVQKPSTTWLVRCWTHTHAHGQTLTTDPDWSG